MTNNSPSLRYYGALEGAWAGTLRVAMTSPGALLRPRVAGLAFLGSARMSTTLAREGERAFVHTTKIEKLGIVLFTGRERIDLGDDRAFALSGEQRTWPAGRALAYAGDGSIDATGTRATYRIPLLGAELAQTTEIVAEGLRIEQRTPWTRAVVLLVRSA